MEVEFFNDFINFYLRGGIFQMEYKIVQSLSCRKAERYAEEVIGILTGHNPLAEYLHKI